MKCQIPFLMKNKKHIQNVIETICMKCQIPFSWKNIISLSFAEFVHSMVSVNVWMSECVDLCYSHIQ